MICMVSPGSDCQEVGMSGNWMIRPRTVSVQVEILSAVAEDKANAARRKNKASKQSRGNNAPTAPEEGKEAEDTDEKDAKKQRTE